MSNFFVVLLLVATFAISNVVAGWTAYFDRIESVHLNEKIYKGNLTSKRHNDSTLLLTAYHEHFETYNTGDVKIKIQTYKLNGNTYEETPLKFDLEYCMTIKSSEWGDMNRDTNVPQACPVPKGVYYMKDMPMNINLDKHGHLLPPNAAGKWKTKVEYQYKDQKYLQNFMYITIKPSF